MSWVHPITGCVFSDEFGYECELGLRRESRRISEDLRRLVSKYGVDGARAQVAQRAAKLGMYKLAYNLLMAIGT